MSPVWAGEILIDTAAGKIWLMWPSRGCIETGTMADEGDWSRATFEGIRRRHRAVNRQAK